MDTDGLSDELLFVLTERPSYRIRFRQYCDSGIWFCLAHLKLLGAVDFDQEDVSTETVTPVRLAP